MSSIKEEEPTEYKILIEFIYQRKRRFFNNRTRNFIQNRPFKFGLRVKNIDEKDSPKGKIKNLSLRSGEGGTIIHNQDEEFSLPELNPGQEVTLWWPDELTTLLKGGAWVQCSVTPEDIKKTKFLTFQFDSNCKKTFQYKDFNAWGDGLIIRGELEQQQARTNFLILILTALVFFNGVWGLGIIFKSILNWLGWLLLNIGTVFTNLK